MGTFTGARRGLVARMAGLCVLAAGLLSPAGAGAGVTVGHSGWYWGNPTPQGMTLHSLAFIGARGYAVGDFGTVLRTDDGGASWSGLRSGVTSDLGSVRELDPNTIIVGGGCTVRRSNDGGATFQRLPFTSSDSNCSAPVASLFFPSPAIGYVALADGSLLATGDGGQTFSLRTAIPGTRAARGSASPTDLSFTGPSTGFVTTDGGQIYTTTDGGNSWRLVASGTPKLNGIFFATPSSGFAVGNNTALYTTSDGGNTWTPGHIAAPSPLTLTTIRCATTMLCVIATQTGNQIVRTTDGGTTWSIVSAATEPTLAADFASAARVVAVGQNGVTVLSNDGGATFSRVGAELPGSYHRLVGQTGGAAYAAGDSGALARTTDGGQTWAPLGVPTAATVRDVSFPTTAVGYALDATGAVFKTPNAGLGWLTLNTGASSAPSVIDAPTPQVVLLGGPVGIRRSTDGGNSFAAVTARAAARARVDRFQNVGALIWASGGRNLIRSADGGASWRSFKLPSSRTSIRSASFVSASTGFVIDTSGRLYQTRTGGQRWSEVVSVGTNALSQVAFSAPLNGFLSIIGSVDAPNGYVLRTTDGGKTWRGQLIAPFSLAQISSPPGPFAYALGGTNGLFAVSGPGDAGAASQLTLSKPSVRKGSKRIVLKGHLAPARGGEQVVVSRRSSKAGSFWKSDTVTVASNGSFSDPTSISGPSTYFVAQWVGDDRGAGVSSKLLTVKSR